MTFDHRDCNRLTFPCALEEEPYDQNLYGSHTGHHQHLNQREIEYPLLCTFDGAEVSILSCPEILLHPADCTQLAADLEDRVLELSCLGIVGAAFRGDLGMFLFVFDL